MLCIVCGVNEEYEKGVCRDCIAGKLALNVNGTLDITECPKCGSMKVGKKWYPDHSDRALSRKIIQMTQISDPTFEPMCDPSDITISHDGAFTNSMITLRKEGFSDLNYEVSIPTRRLRNSCPTCNKVTGSYYEAILQIRSINAAYDNLMDKVKDETVRIMKNLNAKDPESFISTVKKVPEGLDIYLGKRSDGGKLSKYILDNYLSTMKLSKTLAGVRDGEKFYRFTYGVRLAALEKGSVFSTNGYEFLVVNSNSAGVDAINTHTERVTKISKSEFFTSDTKIIEKTPQKREFIVVSRENGEMQLMDKSNYSMITMKGDSDKEEVELYSFDGKYYLPRRA